MGKYDDISPGRLRADLVRFAELVLQLNEEGALLDSAVELQSLLGDLRRKLFAYEVRGASDLLPEDEKDEGPEQDLNPLLEESLRVVQEAIEGQEEMVEGWKKPFDPLGEEEGEA